MEEHKDEGRRHGLAAGVAIPMKDGSGVATAMVSASTPVALGMIGAGLMLAGAMLTGGSWPLQDAGLALVKNVGGRLLAAA